MIEMTELVNNFNFYRSEDIFEIIEGEDVLAKRQIKPNEGLIIREIDTDGDPWGELDLIVSFLKLAKVEPFDSEDLTTSFRRYFRLEPNKKYIKIAYCQMYSEKWVEISYIQGEKNG